MNRTKTAIIVVFLLAGCAGQAIEPSYYLLRSDQEAGYRELQPARDVAMGSVSIAPYLDQPGLVLETDEGKLRPARNHLWAEPLYEGTRTLLLAEISRAMGQDIVLWDVNRNATRFDIRIDQLHGTRAGEAILVAQWWLIDGKSLKHAYHFAENRPLTQDGYAALAAAQKSLLQALAQRIASTLGGWEASTAN